MDTQELRNLQEAYMEVVMGEEKRTFPFQKVKNQINKKTYQRSQISKNEKEGLISPKRASVKRAEMNRDVGYMQHHLVKAKKEKQERDIERRSPTFYGKDKQKMTKTQREQVDIYDIILSHLLDEGYAETPEAAEVIMVNMSEEWRDEIIQEMTQHTDEDLYERIAHDGSFHRDPSETNLPPKPELPDHMKYGRNDRRPAMTYAERERIEANKTQEQKEKEMKQRQELAKTLLRQPQKEQVDIYDIILSHLLDEGYTETPEAAEVIMVNMSEEWRDSIVEEVLEEGWKTKLAKKALKSVGKKIRKSKAYKKATRFATYTALGAIGLPLIGQ